MKICRTCKVEKEDQEFTSKRAECKICDKNISRKQKLKYYYGITLDQYDDMLDQQNGGCKICLRTPQEVGTLVVDHDHDCHPGRIACKLCVRGLLCQDCNIGLGKFFHNGDLLIKAKEYLKEFDESITFAGKVLEVS